jgi:large subunit ribosomal protein L6
MSRVGKLAIPLPTGVRVRQEGRMVLVEGPRGSAQHELPLGVSMEVGGGDIRVHRSGDERRIRAAHGLTRKLIANMVTGVSQGFSRTLEIIGVGYRAELKGDELHMSLGYSHPVVYPLPAGVTARVDRQTIIHLTSNDRQVLGESAAQIRRLRPPEPYKGKGVRYSDEYVRRKAGKAAATGSK